MSARYDELRRAHEQAFSAYAHAQAELETYAGARLRAHQQVILSVLRKVNGRGPEDEGEIPYHTGAGTWASEMAKGFEVVRLDDRYVIVRSIVTPAIQQKTVTYKLPKEWLTWSDRAMAKHVRKDVRRLKEGERAHRAWKASRKVMKLQQEAKAKEKALAELRLTIERTKREARGA